MSATLLDRPKASGGHKSPGARFTAREEYCAGAKFEREKDSAPGDLCPPLARILIALALAGYLLFSHGCHGDEDNELFARWTGAIAAAR